MSDRFFFFSYSHGDRDKCLERFYDDIVQEVSQALGAGNVAFRDIRNVSPGSKWDDEIPRKLASCSALVCLYSPNYLKSEACGKEYTAFRQRVEDYRRAMKMQAWPGLIIPVPWRPLPPPRQSIADRTIISAVQGLPPDAASRGVYFLTRDATDSPLKADSYRMVLDNVVKAIVAGLNDHALPDAGVRRWEDLQDAFALASVRPADVVASPRGGPDRVHFVFVAPSRADRPLARYGDEPSHWQPFQPPDPMMIEPLAYHIAAGENFLLRPAAPLNAILESIDQAENGNSLVVVVIDPWAAKIPAYEGVLRTLDKRQSRHMALLIPWNLIDGDTARSRQELRTRLDELFQNKLDPKDPRTFIDNIETLEAFRIELRNALIFLRGRMQKSPASTPPIPGGFGPLPVLGSK